MLLGVLMSGAVLFAQTPQLVSLSDVSKMTTIERAKFYLNLQPGNLSNVNDFIPALIQGMSDPDDSVRLAAAGKTAYAMVGLQEIRQQGQSIPVSTEQITALKSKLRETINDESAQVRGSAMAALIYSDAPSSENESALLNRLVQEDEGLRYSALKDMVRAGYQSVAIKDAALAGLDAENWKERAKAADVIALFTPDDALPKLGALLKVENGNVEQLSALHDIVGAMAAYGSRAYAYLPALEKLVLDSSIGGTLPDRIRAAVKAIKNPSPQLAATAQIKPVSLVDESPKLPTPTAAAQTTPVPPVTTPSQKQPPSPSTTVAESKSFPWPWIIGAILVLAIAGGILLKLRRK